MSEILREMLLLPRRLSTEEATRWADSFDVLLSHKCKQKSGHIMLKQIIHVAQYAANTSWAQYSLLRPQPSIILYPTWQEKQRDKETGILMQWVQTVFKPQRPKSLNHYFILHYIILYYFFIYQICALTVDLSSLLDIWVGMVEGREGNLVVEYFPNVCEALGSTLFNPLFEIGCFITQAGLKHVREPRMALNWASPAFTHHLPSTGFIGSL